MKIELYKGSMTSRERVLCALNRQEPDRVPVDYSSNPAVHGRLAQSLGLSPEDYEGVLKALGVDTFMTGEKNVLPSTFGGLENWFFTGPSGEQLELLKML